jgi:hypothetical protein
MRQRRATQRHHPGAQNLVDGPRVAADGLDQELWRRLEKPPHLLRAVIGRPLRRPPQVGKQHRDLLTPSVEGFAWIEDVLYEMALLPPLTKGGERSWQFMYPTDGRHDLIVG